MKTGDIILIGFGVLVLIMILLDIVSSIYSITRGREEHAKVMQTQEVIQASALRSVPFEATGFTATRRICAITGCWIDCTRSGTSIRMLWRHRTRCSAIMASCKRGTGSDSADVLKNGMERAGIVKSSLGSLSSDTKACSEGSKA